MAEARIYPPSEQRIAEARRAGHVPRSSLVVFSTVLAGLSLGLYAWGAGFLARLAALWRELLEQCARGHLPPASDVLFIQVPHALWPLFAFLAGICLLTAIFSWLSQGSARRLPFARARRSFSRLAAPRSSKLLWSVLVSLLALAALHEFFRVAPDSAGSAMARWLLRLSALGALVSVLDVVLARTAFMRSLWLTRREYLDDQREAYGSPELRSARAQLRREVAQSALEEP